MTVSKPVRERKMRAITCYLRFAGFERKIKMLQRLPEIHIAVPLPIRLAEPVFPSMSPRLTFEWRRQLTRYTHEYSLKEIKV